MRNVHYMHHIVHGNSQDDFIAWTKSEAFKLHKNAGQHKDIYIGHPVFEGFNVVV